MEYKAREFQDREYTFKDAVKDKALHAIIAEIVLVFTFIACALVIFY